MEADTKPVPFLYRSPLPGTAGIDRYKMVLIQYRICTVMFTGLVILTQQYWALPHTWKVCTKYLVFGLI